MASFKESLIDVDFTSASLIDTAECVVTCISIVMGVTLVYHEYCIVTWCKTHFRDLSTLADKDSSSSDALSDNLSN